jgi:hypothetical protein
LHGKPAPTVDLTNPNAIIGGMSESRKATVTNPCDGLVQASFPHHKCRLSIAFKTGSYATFLFGERYDTPERQHIPLSYEIGVFNEEGSLIQITPYDTVAPYQTLDMVRTILAKMEDEDFNPKDLEMFCD